MTLNDVPTLITEAAVALTALAVAINRVQAAVAPLWAAIAELRAKHEASTTAIAANTAQGLAHDIQLTELAKAIPVPQQSPVVGPDGQVAS